MPPPHVCDLTHCDTVRYNVWHCAAVGQREGERGDKKERKGLPHRQIWDLEAPLVPQSQLLGSDGCLRLAVWCPFIHGLTSLTLSPSFARRRASRGCRERSCHNYRINLSATVWFLPLLTLLLSLSLVILLALSVFCFCLFMGGRRDDNVGKYGVGGFDRKNVYWLRRRVVSAFPWTQMWREKFL